ncbi:MAG: YkvA family protein [Chloroflexota bacterium]|nr:YkvA family protein [Chloroflexota bacterium]
MSDFDVQLKKWFAKFKTKARELKRQTYLLYLAYRSPDTPWYAKLFGALVVAYAFSPVDLMPDFIPILGYLDDLILVPVGIALGLKMIPEEVLVEAQIQAESEFLESKPQNWVVGGIIIAIWVIVLALVVFWTVRWIAGLRGGGA